MIVFQPCNGAGLGHVSRLASIALAVRAAAPGISQTFVSPVSAQLLLDALGLPSIPLPPDPKRGLNTPEAPWRERVNLAMSDAILETLTPDLVVFDCFPHRSFARRTIAKDIPIALCVRRMRKMAQYLAAVEEWLPHIALFIIPHEDDQGFEMCRSARRVVTGTITRPTAVDAIDWLDPSARVMLITGGGGGGDGTLEFYSVALRAFEVAGAEEPGLECVLVAGPLFRHFAQLRLPSGVRVLPFAADMRALYQRASVVVCQGGYNTIAEIVEAGCPTVCVAIQTQFDDQHERVRRVAASGAPVVPYAGGEVEGLAAAIRQSLRENRGMVVPVSTGAVRAAAAVIDLLRAEAPTGHNAGHEA